MFLNISFFLTVSLMLLTAKYEYPPQGEGIVTILLAQTSGESASFDSSAIIKTYRYFIKDHKILQRDSLSSMELPNPAANKTNRPNGAGLNVTGSVRTINSVYLIDLKTQLTYTYYKKDKKLYIAVDSLNRHFADNYYRITKEAGSAEMMYLLDENAGTVAGKACFRAKAINGKKDTILLKCAVSQMKVRSPLNCHFPDCKYPILAIDFPPQSGNGRTARFHMQVGSISEKPLSNVIFKLPKNEGLRYNVPKEDLIKGADIQ